MGGGEGDPLEGTWDQTGCDIILPLERTWDQTGSDIIPPERNMGPDRKWHHTPLERTRDQTGSDIIPL